MPMLSLVPDATASPISSARKGIPGWLLPCKWSYRICIPKDQRRANWTCNIFFLFFSFLFIFLFMIHLGVSCTWREFISLSSQCPPQRRFGVNPSWPRKPEDAFIPHGAVLLQVWQAHHWHFSYPPHSLDFFVSPVFIHLPPQPNLN